MTRSKKKNERMSDRELRKLSTKYPNLHINIYGRLICDICHDELTVDTTTTESSNLHYGANIGRFVQGKSEIVDDYVEITCGCCKVYDIEFDSY